ncbi:DUF397 domain-containing protein [Streptomyces chrestomyceticus]|uniref:DUF397 domain-containing protein n=1 Tax=Streptomyces chrestomyceticus TaxID=68185 RepID=UPI0033E18F02
MDVAINTNLMAPDVAAADEWQKSSYSTQEGGSCVELARRTRVGDKIAVRDSKDVEGPALLFSKQAWSQFVSGLEVPMI